MNEIWKPILNYENYECSNTGKIRRLSNGIELKLRLDDREYISVMLWSNKKRYKKRIHRLIWNTFNECDCPYTIDHIDQDKNNNHLDNLRCITNKENSNNKPTASNKTNKYNLTDELKRYLIKSIRKGLITSYQIYKKYKIPSNYISVIKKRKSWDNL